VTSLAHFAYSAGAFILILMPLVIIHELGHFLFAKLFGVRADIFSVGFGPTLFKYKKGETEFRLSAIPLGGYVKLLGQEDEDLTPEELPRSLNTQPAWHRFWIYVGGPLFNFILSLFLFAFVLFYGESRLSNYVARVVKNSFAEKVGFQREERILKINDEPIAEFEAIEKKIAENPSQLSFLIEKTDHTLRTLNVTPVILNEKPRIPGLSAFARASVIGIANPLSPAAKAGLKTADTILSVQKQNSLPVLIKSFEQLEAFFQENPGPLVLKTEEKSILIDRQNASLEELGIFSSELFFHEVIADSAAAKAGLQKNDRILSLNGTPLYSFADLKDLVQSESEKNASLNLEIERQGVIQKVSLKANAKSTRDSHLRPYTQYTIGVIPYLIYAEPHLEFFRVTEFFPLISQATQKMLVITGKNFLMFKKMLFREASVDGIGGPLMIGKIAGESLSRGVSLFITNMAIFSIGLGVLNILPIPLLDGGHIALLFLELIRRKPLTLKQAQFAQSIGLAFVGMLMLIAFRNDFLRLLN
jgi:regulator of sigma E protease